MDFFTIRNKKQASDLAKMLLERRLPYKVAVQDIFPTRSVDFNDYLWGFIYTPIADATGHSPEEIHEYYKRIFNFRHDFVFNSETKKYNLVTGVGSTTTLDTKEIWEYALKIRADAELELHLLLMLPNEAFISELQFDNDKIEEHRL